MGTRTMKVNAMFPCRQDHDQRERRPEQRNLVLCRSLLARNLILFVRASFFPSRRSRNAPSGVTSRTRQQWGRTIPAPMDPSLRTIPRWPTQKKWASSLLFLLPFFCIRVPISFISTTRSPQLDPWNSISVTRSLTDGNFSSHLCCKVLEEKEQMLRKWVHSASWLWVLLHNVNV